jgi:hypothetical protein
VFALLQQQEVKEKYQKYACNLPGLVFESSNTFLTYTCHVTGNWSKTLFFFFLG